MIILCALNNSLHIIFIGLAIGTEKYAVCFVDAGAKTDYIATCYKPLMLHSAMVNICHSAYMGDHSYYIAKKYYVHVIFFRREVMALKNTLPWGAF